jgi:sodium/hydrogen antiporter
MCLDSGRATCDIVRTGGAGAMSQYALAVIAGAFALYALVSRRLAATPLTGPMLFVGLGVLIGPKGLGVLAGENEHLATVTFEATLVLVLFTDAMAVNRGSWRSEIALPTRLLGIGLPLTIVLGWLLAAVLFGEMSVWEAAIVGTILAPTDAALGQAVVSNPRVPELVRQALNVESGLNDGIALPVLLVFVGLAEHASDHTMFVVVFLQALVLAAGIGAAAGWLGAKSVIAMARRGWIGPHWQQIFILAVALFAYGLATPLGGSGFIAAWAGGCAMGFGLRAELPEIRVLPEDLANLLTAGSFLLFGALYVGPALGDLTWAIALYAVLSLTVARMGPVAAATAGTHLARPTVLYLGWFGPRGLASIVFADLIVGSAVPHVALIRTIVNVTVVASVLAHGVTARPGAERYADWYERRLETEPTMPEAGRVTHIAGRRRLLHQES